MGFRAKVKTKLTKLPTAQDGHDKMQGSKNINPVDKSLVLLCLVGSYFIRINYRLQNIKRHFGNLLTSVKAHPFPTK